MLKRIGLSVFVAVAAFAIWHTGRDLRFRLQAASPLPDFTVSLENYHMENGQRTLTGKQTVSRRSLDGAMTQTITLQMPGVTDVSRLSTGRVVTLPSRVSMHYVPDLNMKSTVYLTEEQTADKLRVVAPNRYCVSKIDSFSLLGEDKIFGLDAYILQWQVKGRTMDRFKSWRVPELGCMELKTQHEVQTGADQWELRDETVPVAFKPEAEAELFVAPEGVLERKPSEIMEAYLQKLGRSITDEERTAFQKSNDTAYNERRSPVCGSCPNVKLK